MEGESGRDGVVRIERRTRRGEGVRIDRGLEWEMG